MARNLYWAAVVAVLVSIGQPAAAQSLAQASAAARKAPAVDPAVRADVEKLMKITNQSMNSAQIATLMSNVLINGFVQSRKQAQKPVPPRAIEIVRDVVSSEFVKAFDSSDIQDRLIAVYAKYFTPAEIKELIAFYETDLGRKAIANMPHLVREGAAIGEQWGKETMPAVMKVLETRLKAEGFEP